MRWSNIAGLDDHIITQIRERHGTAMYYETPNVAGLDGQGVANVECTCNHCKHEDGDGDEHEIMVILIIMVAIIIIKFAIITMIFIPNPFYL